MKKLILITILIVIPLTTRADLGSGLVGFWPIDARGNNLTAATSFDRSSTGANLILVNSPTITTGVIGQAMRLNGSNQNASGTSVTNVNFSSSTPMTISVWIKTTVNDTGTYAIMSTWNLSASSGWHLEYGGSGTAGKFDFLFVNSAGTQIMQARDTTTTNDGRWHLLTFTSAGSRSNAGFSFFVDGIDAGKSNLANNNPGVMANSVFTVGRLTGGTPEYFPGSLDNIRIYNRQLSPEEIRDLYRQGSAAHYGSFMDSIMGTIGGFI